MTTKLEIIGPYTPDHDGPYVWSKGTMSRCTIHSIVQGVAFITPEHIGSPLCTDLDSIMNAREVRVPREFWINEYEEDLSTTHRSLEAALSFLEGSQTFARTIHVREVLEGE